MTTNTNTVVESEILPPQDHTPSTRRGAPPARLSEKHPALEAVGEILTNYMQLIGVIIRPPKEVNLPEPRHITVSIPDVESEFKKLYGRGTHLNPNMITAMTALLRDIHQRNGALYKRVQSWLRSFFQTGVETRWLIYDLNEIIKMSYDIVRKYHTLEYIYEKRPAFLKNIQGITVEVADEYYTNDDDLSAHLGEGTRYYFATTSFIGILFSGFHFARSGWIQCQLDRVEFYVRGNRERVAPIVREWKLWIQKVRDLKIPEFDPGRDWHWQEVIQLQGNGMVLLEKNKEASDYLELDGARFQQCTLSHVTFRADAGHTLSGIHLEDCALDHVSITVNIVSWRIGPILSPKYCYHLTIRNAALDGCTFERFNCQGGIWENVVLRGSFLRELVLESMDLHNIRMDGGSWQKVTLRGCRLSGYLHLGGQCSDVILEEPIIEDTLEITGQARGVRIHRAEGVLSRMDVSALAIIRLTLDECGKTIQFASHTNVEKLVADGHLIVTGMEIPDPFQPELDPSMETGVIAIEGGLEILKTQSDRLPRLTDRARENVQLFHQTLYERWREQILAVARNNNPLLLVQLLQQIGCLPYPRVDLEKLLRELQTFKKMDDRGFAETCRGILGSTPNLEAAYTEVGDSLKKKGYLIFDERVLKGRLAKWRQEMKQSNQSTLEHEDSFLRYLRKYSGPPQALVEAIHQYLTQELPHLLPIDPLWLESFWQTVKNSPQRRVSNERRDTVAEDANRLDQIENLLNYYADKIHSVENDVALEPEERERMKDVWIRLRERQVQHLEEDDFEPPGNTGKQDNEPPDPFDFPTRPKN